MFWQKKLNKADLLEFQARVRLISQEKHKYFCIRKNTVLVHKGQQFAEQIFDLINILEQSLKDWIGEKLNEYGCEKGIQYSINENTGVINEIGPTNEELPEPIKKEYERREQLKQEAK